MKELYFKFYEKILPIIGWIILGIVFLLMIAILFIEEGILQERLFSYYVIGLFIGCGINYIAKIIYDSLKSGKNIFQFIFHDEKKHISSSVSSTKYNMEKYYKELLGREAHLKSLELNDENIIRMDELNLAIVCIQQYLLKK